MVRLRLLGLLTYSGVLALGQDDTIRPKQYPLQVHKFQSLEVVTFVNKIEIRRGSREWHIALSELPIYAKDCEARMDRKRCQSLPKRSPCLACIEHPDVIAWDEPHQKLYFAVATGTAKNRPWVIFRYNLPTRRITRMMSDYGAGYTSGTVSRSGQYLAYVGYASYGVCGTQSYVGVMDLWSRRRASARSKRTNTDEVVRIQSLCWTDLTTIQYSADIYRESDCRNSESGTYPKRAITDSVNLTGITFQ